MNGLQLNDDGTAVAIVQPPTPIEETASVHWLMLLGHSNVMFDGVPPHRVPVPVHWPAPFHDSVKLPTIAPVNVTVRF